MAAEDYFDPYGDPEDDEESEVRCKYCRERYLHWEKARGERNQKKFVLMNEDGLIHNCPAFGSATASADEFEEIIE